MTRERLKIHRWLAAICSLLIVPSLLLAVLWVSDARREVRRAEVALNGIDAIEALYPLVEARTLGRAAPEIVNWPALVAALEPQADAAEALDTLYRRTRAHPSDVEAAAALKTLVRRIADAAHLQAATPAQASGLAQIVTHQTLFLSERSLHFLATARALSRRDAFNPWDRMSLPVQGGQYKAVSDTLAVARRGDLGDQSAWDREVLDRLTAGYARANVAFQKAAADLIVALGEADSGSELRLEALGAAYPPLAEANNALWLASLKTLKNILAARRSGLRTTLAVTGLLCVASIGAAVAAAGWLARAFASRARREMEDIGFHDPLTGLPNRRALIRTLDAMLLNAGRELHTVAVLHVDVTRFRAVNDSYGEQIGDALLRETAQALTRLCDGGMVMRIGGTEFAVVAQKFRRKGALGELAERIVLALAGQRVVAGCVCQTGVAIGIAVAEGLKPGAEQMLMDAELARRAAKARGANGYLFFRREMRLDFQKRNALAEQIHAAIRRDEFEPWFQPQVAIGTGRVKGVEALVRWVDPEEGVRGPAAFLGVAEEFGLIDELDAAVRRKALRAMQAWRGAGLEIEHVGINMNATQLSRADLVDRLVAETGAAGLAPFDVAIEVLESVVIDEAAAEPIRANVARLSDLGFFIELDDFGTGHAGISSLRDLKVNRVKIDRSFVAGVDGDGELGKLTNALIQLALSLNVEVLAEGVEREAERAWLAARGCQIAQGYLVARPMPFSAAGAWMRRADQEVASVLGGSTAA